MRHCLRARVPRRRSTSRDRTRTGEDASRRAWLTTCRERRAITASLARRSRHRTGFCCWRRHTAQWMRDSRAEDEHRRLAAIRRCGRRRSSSRRRGNRARGRVQEAGARAPRHRPRCTSTPVVQKDVPVYLDLGRTDRGISGRRDPGAGRRLSRDDEFPRRARSCSKGALLYQIDPQAARGGARARPRPTRRRRRRRSTRPSNDVARYTPLVAKQAVSRQELDNAQSAQDAARAQVEAASAAIDKATLDLGYTRVTAPISGLVGTTKVKPGNLVGRGESTLLTTISQIDPILFRVGDHRGGLPAPRQAHPGARRQAAATGGIKLTLADGTVHPHTGSVRTIERAVNPATGTLGVELVFPNPGSTLRPGQYGKARVLIDTKVGALLVPQRAVQELQGLYSVAVVDAENKVAFRNVKVGPRVRDAVGDRTGPEAGRPGRRRRAAGDARRHRRSGPSPWRAAPAATTDTTPPRQVGHGALLRQPADRRDGAVDHPRAARRRRDARAARSRSIPKSCRR